MFVSGNIVEAIYRGSLGNYFFCAKQGEDFRLFRTMVNCRVPNGIGGKLVDSNGQFERSGITQKTKGEYAELMMGNIHNPPIFKPKAKVLAMKPDGKGSFEKKFRLATVVSEQKVESTSSSSRACGTNSRNTRHTYDLVFSGEKEKITVFEELIVPTEEYWGKDILVFEPKDDSSSSSSSDSESSFSDTSSSSESESSSSDTSSSSESSSSDSSDSKKKVKKHKEHKKSHRSHKTSHKHHRKHPNVIIIPIFMPFPPIQQNIGYRNYF